MICDYYFYMKENGISFLPKLYGCYVLLRKFKKKRTKIYFIVMANVFSTSNHIDLRFDLKGSKIGRKVLTGTENDSKIFSSGDMALKDLDFDKIDERVYVGNKREIILTQLRKDINFLYSINSNDYSLLLGIHYLKNNEFIENKKEESNSTSIFSSRTFETNSMNLSKTVADDRINEFRKFYELSEEDIGQRELTNLMREKVGDYFTYCNY